MYVGCSKHNWPWSRFGRRIMFRGDVIILVPIYILYVQKTSLKQILSNCFFNSHFFLNIRHCALFLLKISMNTWTNSLKPTIYLGSNAWFLFKQIPQTPIGKQIPLTDRRDQMLSSIHILESRGLKSWEWTKFEQKCSLKIQNFF